MSKQKLSICLLSLLLLLFAVAARAQDTTAVMAPVDDPWYVGIGVGTSFGQSTFWSITDKGVRSWGIQGGVFGGYKFNRLISTEVGFQYGSQSQYNMPCCPYWVSTNGEWAATQVIDKDGWYFNDLQVATQWYRLVAQANFNLLSFIPGNSRWSLEVSPQIALVNTRSTWKGNLSKSGAYHEEAQPSNWHFGGGGQLSAGYAIGDNWKVGIYGGLAALTGKRFDMIPNKDHETNLIWDAGVKLSFRIGNTRKKKAEERAAAELAAQEAARQQAEQERLAAEKKRQEEQAAREKAEAERLAREKAEKEAAEQAARENAEKEAAFNTPIANVYFGSGATRVEAVYEPSLEEVLATMQKYPDFRLRIYGYSSKSGGKAYNQKLSVRRMEAVQKWFVDHGIEADRVSDVKACGVDPAAPEDGGRRVELKFVK